MDGTSRGFNHGMGKIVHRKLGFCDARPMGLGDGGRKRPVHWGLEDIANRSNLVFLTVCTKNPNSHGFGGTDETVFAQWCAAHFRQPYTTPPVVSAHVIYQRHLNLPLGLKLNAFGGPMGHKANKDAPTASCIGS